MKIYTCSDLDCKTVSRMKQSSFTHSSVSLSVFSLAPDLLFDCLRVLEYAKIRTVLQSSSYRSIDLCVLRDACHELFCVFGDFYTSGTQDTEVTKSLTQYNLLPIIHGKLLPYIIIPLLNLSFLPFPLYFYYS